LAFEFPKRLFPSASLRCAEVIRIEHEEIDHCHSLSRNFVVTSGPPMLNKGYWLWSWRPSSTSWFPKDGVELHFIIEQRRKGLLKAIARSIFHYRLDKHYLRWKLQNRTAYADGHQTYVLRSPFGFDHRWPQSPITANLILLSTGEQKIEEGLNRAPAEMVARENNACRRVIAFCFHLHILYCFSLKGHSSEDPEAH
jgi:hypothetical protein